MSALALDRLMAKVELQPDGCWIFTGGLDTRGYGNFWFEGKTMRAHRVLTACWSGRSRQGFRRRRMAA